MKTKSFGLLAGLILFVVLMGCASSPPPFSAEFVETIEAARVAGKGSVEGYYFICEFEERFWSCPRPRGPVRSTRERAEEDLEAYLKEHPEYRGFARVKSTSVSTAASE